LISGSIVPCVHLGRVFGCGVGSAGALGATSTAVTHNDAYAPWWAAGARAGAELPLAASLSLRAYAELLAMLARNSLWIDGRQEYLFRPLSGSLGMAIAWHFL
jgi:hypothetical protein